MVSSNELNKTNEQMLLSSNQFLWEGFARSFGAATNHFDLNTIVLSYILQIQELKRDLRDIGDIHFDRFWWKQKTEGQVKDYAENVYVHYETSARELNSVALPECARRL